MKISFPLSTLLILLLACASCSRQLEVSINPPGSDTAVYGILKCEAAVTGGTGDVTVVFYYDKIDNSSRIEPVTASGGVFTAAWHTTEVANGQHTLFAVARDAVGASAQAQAVIDIYNFTRDETIPADVVKMTPENDPHPPCSTPIFLICGTSGKILFRCPVRSIPRALKIHRS